MRHVVAAALLSASVTRESGLSLPHAVLQAKPPSLRAGLPWDVFVAVLKGALA